jgi:Chlorhexidine efflux transporter
MGQRPHRLRLLHAMGLETSSVVLSCPVIVAMTPLGWWQALAADVVLTLVYAAYGYACHQPPRSLVARAGRRLEDARQRRSAARASFHYKARCRREPSRRFFGVSDRFEATLARGRE